MKTVGELKQRHDLKKFGKLDDAQSLDAFYAAIQFEQYDGLRDLVYAISDPLLRNDLVNKMRDFDDRLHDANALHMQAWMLQNPGAISSEDYRAMQRSFLPTRDAAFATFKRSIGAKLLFWWSNQ